ncbi:MAG: DUF2339 domain-containing protein [Phycisphaerales bacterium]|nr:DUF2339 domain-containing protein [Phycisphaerales bacterium]
MTLFEFLGSCLVLLLVAEVILVPGLLVAVIRLSRSNRRLVARLQAMQNQIYQLQLAGELSTRVTPHASAAPTAVAPAAASARAATAPDSAASSPETSADALPPQMPFAEPVERSLPKTTRNRLTAPSGTLAGHRQQFSAGLRDKSSVFAARAAIAIGAIALALGGIFLLKYTFDSGILSPPVRVILGCLFGIGLLVTGMLLRRSSNFTGQGLVAAGVSVVYAAVVAAASLYHLINPTLAFVLLAIWTAMAVGLSLEVGMLVAILGLLGGFFMPLLLTTAHPQASGLFFYLLLLQAGLLLAGWRKRWFLVSVLTALAAFFWIVLWLVFFQPHGPDAAALGLFILATAVLLVIAALAGERDILPDGADSFGVTNHAWQALAWLGGGLSIITSGWLLKEAGFDNLQWSFIALLTAGAMLVARLRNRMYTIAWLALSLCIAMLGLWTWRLVGPPLALRGTDGFPWLWTAWGNVPVGKVATGTNLHWLNIWLEIFGGLFGLGGYACIWRARRSNVWAWFSVLGVAAILLIGLWGRGFHPRNIWALTAVGIAVVYGLSAWAVGSYTQVRGNTAVQALVVGATGFVALAIMLRLTNAMCTLTLAVEIPLLVLLWRWLGGRELAGAAIALTLAVLVRLCANRAIFAYPVSPSPWHNWIVGVYTGITCLLIAGRLIASKPGEEVPPLRNLLEFAAIVVALAGGILVVRHAFHPIGWGNTFGGLLERGLYPVWLLVVALGLKLSAKRKTTGLRAAMATALGGSGIWLTVIATGMFFNPMLDHLAVQGPLGLETLLPVYGLPTVLGAALACLMHRDGQQRAARGMAIGSVICLFIMTNLIIRAAFHGSLLYAGTTAQHELYAYSVLWIVLGIALALLAAVVRGPVLRYTSLVVLLLAVAKVFLIDTAHLQSLLRVLSLVGLGLSLMTIGYVYQRFVFVRGPNSPNRNNVP